jgi:PHD/YefM family antitoxin component YafN of YafNO toxin-antitoxin module
MVTASVAEVIERFDTYTERAQHEPVMVKKDGRDYIVILNAGEYVHLQATDDARWARMAGDSEERGFAEPTEVAALLCRLGATN